MKQNIAVAHMKVAKTYASLSHAVRKKVGCVIVGGDTVVAIGWNGMPSGESNVCEDENGKTKPEVIHAEDNALRKLTHSHESAEGAEVFITLQPCLNCAVRLADAKVNTVYYAEKYPSALGGIEYLLKKGIRCEYLGVI